MNSEAVAKRKDPWAHERTIIDTQLRRIVESEEVVEPLGAAVRHALFPAGKRVRPLFSLVLASELDVSELEYDPELIAVPSIALELIHNSSLIHDDLPAMDDDHMRRGRPSCHAVYGEATAILAGDYLVALAMKVLAQCSLPEAVRLRMVSELSLTYMQLCNGQQRDLTAEEQTEDEPSVSQLEETHSLKTGALFRASFMFAALAIGAREKVIKLCAELGLQFGICFQIADDYIDLHGTSAQRGRETSSDVRNDKKTYFSGDESFGKAAMHSHCSRLNSLISKLEGVADITHPLNRTRKLIETSLEQCAT